MPVDLESSASVRLEGAVALLVLRVSSITGLRYVLRSNGTGFLRFCQLHSFHV